MPRHGDTHAADRPDIRNAHAALPNRSNSQQPPGFMKRSLPAANPAAYVAALAGWRGACVRELRAAVRGAAQLEEIIKWGHLVYFANGPVLLIRAEDERVLLGFWRGKRLRDVEPRLRP